MCDVVEHFKGGTSWIVCEHALEVRVGSFSPAILLPDHRTSSFAPLCTPTMHSHYDELTLLKQ